MEQITVKLFNTPANRAAIIAELQKLVSGESNEAEFRVGDELFTLRLVETDSHNFVSCTTHVKKLSEVKNLMAEERPFQSVSSGVVLSVISLGESFNK